MLKALRRQFVKLSMGVLAGVFLVLLAGLNVANYAVGVRNLDAMLEIIAQSGGELPPYPEQIEGARPWSFRYTAETPFETRFFIVYTDAQGEVLKTHIDNVAALARSEAEALALEALATGRARGFSGEYRFRVQAIEDGKMTVFLDAGGALQSMRSLLAISAATVALVLALVFALVWLFSRRVLRPVAQNIDRQKQFITDAGHELKTPLTIIAASTDMLLSEAPANEWARTIHSQTDRLSRLTADLVALARLEERDACLNMRDFSLTDAAWDAVAPFQKLARAVGKRLDVQIEDGVRLHGDEAAVQRLLSILLDNAVKYSDGEGEIRLLVGRRRRQAVIEVQNPCRLPGTADLDRLFDRFYRADPSRSSGTGGSGVGLSIARSIVQLHRGDIFASSPDGLSLLVSARLPGQR